MDTLPPLYVCGYKDCQTNPSKKINIERHIWLVHVRETMSCQHTKYNCSQHKGLVTPYVRCVRESKRGLKKLRNQSKDIQPVSSLSVLRHTPLGSRTHKPTASIRSTQSVPSINHRYIPPQTGFRSHCSLSPKRHSDETSDNFGGHRHSDDHLEIERNNSRAIEEDHSDNVLLNTRNGIISDISRFYSEQYTQNSLSVYTRSSGREDTRMSDQNSTPSRRLTAGETETGASIWRPW